uniref:Uncharacterized protein n=1 Tax=Peronospora matthiolae TaxID=2874970 RepID=A0AAV1U2E6_9STRA
MTAGPAVGSYDGQAECRALALVDRQVVYPPLPLAPLAGMRPSPPVDRRRALVSISIPQISDHPVAPDPAQGEGDGHIDQTDWAAAWETLKSGWPIHSKFRFPQPAARRRSGSKSPVRRPTTYFGW